MDNNFLKKKGRFLAQTLHIKISWQNREKGNTWHVIISDVKVPKYIFKREGQQA